LAPVETATEAAALAPVETTADTAAVLMETAAVVLLERAAAVPTRAGRLGAGGRANCLESMLLPPRRPLPPPRLLDRPPRKSVDCPSPSLDRQRPVQKRPPTLPLQPPRPPLPPRALPISMFVYLSFDAMLSWTSKEWGIGDFTASKMGWGMRPVPIPTIKATGRFFTSSRDFLHWACKKSQDLVKRCN